MPRSSRTERPRPGSDPWIGSARGAQTGPGAGRSSAPAGIEETHGCRVRDRGSGITICAVGADLRGHRRVASARCSYLGHVARTRPRPRIGAAHRRDVSSRLPVCHSFLDRNARAATCGVTRRTLQHKVVHRVDTRGARRYCSLRSRAAEGIGGRKSPPSGEANEGRESREHLTDWECATALRDRGCLGPPFGGSRDRVDNARVWGRRGRLQRFLGPPIRLLNRRSRSSRSCRDPRGTDRSTRSARDPVAG